MTGLPQPFAASHPNCTSWTTDGNDTKWTSIGEVHTSANSTGDFMYTSGSQTTIDAEYSPDSGAHWSANGTTTWTDGVSGSDDWGNDRPQPLHAGAGGSELQLGAG
jgi:hypothetical protein